MFGLLHPFQSVEGEGGEGMKKLLLIGLLALIIIGCGEDDHDDYYSSSVEPRPCIDVYNSIYNPCWEDCLEWCDSISCLICSADCSSEANRQARICCQQRYGSGEDYERCMEYYRSMSFDEYIVDLEKCECGGAKDPTTE